MPSVFYNDHRLGISIPKLDKYWENYSVEEREEILKMWEHYRADIPTRIKEIEAQIEHKQKQLNIEESFTRSCQLNDEIVDLASIINELNIWFRIQQTTHSQN